MMKVKLFTHNDLDAVGCAILATAVYGEDLDVTYCKNPDDASKKVDEFIGSNEVFHFDKIFITDISVNEAIASELELIHNQQSDMDVILLDHHETAAWLNMYEWATVTEKHESLFTTRELVNSSGTSMLYHYLLLNSSTQEESQCIANYRHFVELVRQYDSWDWYNIYDDSTPKHLNDLFYIIGRDLFVDKILKDMSTPDSPLFSETDYLLLNLEQEKIDRYIEISKKKLTVTTVGKYKIGVVFGESYVSEVCHAIHKEYSELDLVAMVDLRSRKVSYRTDREDINVGEFAKYFGGGGRQATAGSQLENIKLDQIVNVIFK